MGQKEVPDVTGKTRAQAKSLIEGAGFVYKETAQQDPTAEKDTIISQNPGPKAQADQGSDVTVVYSSGPPTVEVPDVTGQSEATGCRPTWSAPGSRSPASTSRPPR